MSKKQAHFGNTMKAAMRDQDIIAADLARKMDVHPQQMSDWMNRESVTTITESKIARALGLSMGEFWSYGD